MLEKKRILSKYQSQVEGMEEENKNKEKELLELWLQVQERKGIDKLAGWFITLEFVSFKRQ